MQILENQALQPFNTFGIAANARFFGVLRSVEDIDFVYQNTDWRALKKMILGGGSNLLLTGDFDGLLLKNELRGIEKIAENEQYVFVRAGAGEAWHELVQWCLRQDYGGIENLSLIPGTVGAAPIQNIGAYGVELKDVFEELEAYDLTTNALVTLRAVDCAFGYRDSIFKTAARGRYIITAVTLRLAKPPHRINTDYGDIKATLAAQGVLAPTIQAVSAAVTAIRKAKLPDPAVIGNSGSFFKNPTISAAFFDDLKQQFPTIIGYAMGVENVKVPAGWLIEQCGWKGKRIGNTGAHDKQALVLVNYGNATGQEVWALAQAIQASVRQRFGVDIEPEVNVV